MRIDELNGTADKVVAEDFTSVQMLNQASAERPICKGKISRNLYSTL